MPARRSPTAAVSSVRGRDAHTGRHHRRGSGGPVSRASALSRGHRLRRARGAQPRLCGGSRARRRAGAGHGRPDARARPRSAAAARMHDRRGDRHPLRRQADPHPLSRAGRRQGGDDLRPAGGREGPDRGAHRGRRRDRVRGGGDRLRWARQRPARRCATARATPSTRSPATSSPAATAFTASAVRRSPTACSPPTIMCFRSAGSEFSRNPRRSRR